MDVDRLADWLLNGIEWKTTVFHVGQYCGRWSASTSGHGLASFHVVLRGQCYFHRPGQAPELLREGDGVFLLRDDPHHLSSDPDGLRALQKVQMQATVPVHVDGTALACGFFHFTGPVSAWLLQSLNAPLRLSRAHHDGDLARAAQVFELMRQEADQAATLVKGEAPPSPLVERLASVLFHYVLRHALRAELGPQVPPGLWKLSKHPVLSGLLPKLIEAPADDWTAERLAAQVHMSRAKFYRLFLQVAGEPPAQFLLRLRMQMAAQHLHQGETPTRAAERVGYQSPAAFHRAFSRVMGRAPGRFQREGYTGESMH